MCLDGEILPWAVKASASSEESDLVEAGRVALDETNKALEAGHASAVLRHWQEIIQAERSALERYDTMFKRSPRDAVHECVLGVLAQEVTPTMST